MWFLVGRRVSHRNPEMQVRDCKEEIGHWKVVRGKQESIYCIITSRAFLVVVLELRWRCFFSVCVNTFGLAQRVHIPSWRAAHHAALVSLAVTAPSQVDSGEGCLHCWRVLLETFEMGSGSMLKDVKIMPQKDPCCFSIFDSYWYLCVCSESAIRHLDHLLVCLKNSCIVAWS